jgi:hypothetical protein
MATKKAGKSAASLKKAGAELEARYRAVLGGHGATVRLARALGKTPVHLYRYWRGERRAPQYMVAFVEFLEQVPKESWPERWRWWKDEDGSVGKSEELGARGAEPPAQRRDRKAAGRG